MLEFKPNLRLFFEGYLFFFFNLWIQNRCAQNLYTDVKIRPDYPLATCELLLVLKYMIACVLSVIKDFLKLSRLLLKEQFFFLHLNPTLHQYYGVCA